MAIPNADTLIPALLSEYVQSRRADLGLPLASALPFVLAPSNDDQVFPRVLFATTEQGFPHPRRARLKIAVELQTSAERQDLPQEHQWTAGLRYALADKAAFLAWLGLQTEAKRTGYAVRKMFLEDAGMGVDDSSKVRARTTVVVIEIRSDELAPPQVPDAG